MPTQILNLSSADLQKAARLQARIEQLRTDLAKILGGGEATEGRTERKGRRTMSATQRARLSKAAKARWKKAKAAGKTTL
jgi:hypothetical protein